MNLWPYVNGKAISLGIKIAELPSSDLLDLLHFFFEEDANSLQSAEQSDARDKTRSTIYSAMYNREYKFSVSSSQTSRIDTGIVGPAMNDGIEDDLPTPVDPMARGGGFRKPYIPATEVNSNSQLPFGSALDGPLG